MSQYLFLTLKKKDNQEIKVDLGYYCTTLARRISNLGIFTYTQDDKLVSNDELYNSIDVLKNELETYVYHRDKTEKEISEYKESLLKAKTEEACQHIQNMINSSEESLLDWKEEADTWTSVLNKLKFVSEVLHENKEDWQLFYSNCLSVMIGFLGL